MDDVIQSINSSSLTAFLLLMILTWIFVGTGIVLAGLLRPTLPAPATQLMDPTGTAADRAGDA